MTDVKLAVMGAAGRMGQALVRMVSETPGCILVAAFEQPESGTIGKDSGILSGMGENGIAITADVEQSLVDSDGVIDFTTPETSVTLSALAGKTGCVHVIGTTGCSTEQDEAIAKNATKTAIVKSGNMSLGVNLLAVLVEQAAKALQANDFDIEVLEMHHKHKVDAPSGTALMLGEAAAAGRDVLLEKNSVRTRDGITGARENGSIGFAILRGGSVIGDHSVIFAGGGERIEISHSALDRSLFATGAVKAALWGQGKSPGLYSMRDVLGL